MALIKFIGSSRSMFVTGNSGEEYQFFQVADGAWVIDVTLQGDIDAFVADTDNYAAYTLTTPVTDPLMAIKENSDDALTVVQAIQSRIGEVQASPTTNTLLDRLKTLATYLGALTETAPASDTESSGVNGRLQRIAQRLTTFFGAEGDSAPALATNASGTLGWLRKLVDHIGEVQASPTENTLLDRLKTIGTNTGQLPGHEYETVAAGQTDQVLGATGGAGDYLHSLICVVATAATSAVSIKDGAGSAISVLPDNVGGGIGTYTVPLGLASADGAWKITTGAGVSVVAAGRFT
jgi:hypothetical protein